MVALAELGIDGLSQQREEEIFQAIRSKAEPAGSLPGRIARLATECGLYSRVWNDDNKLTTLARQLGNLVPWDVDVLLREHQAALAEAGVEVTSGRVYAPEVLGILRNHGRVLLVVSVQLSDGLDLHYLLVREEEGRIWVMDPDGGMNHAWSEEQFFMFLPRPFDPTARHNFIGIVIGIQRP